MSREFILKCGKQVFKFGIEMKLCILSLITGLLKYALRLVTYIIYF